MPINYFANSLVDTQNIPKLLKRFVLVSSGYCKKKNALDWVAYITGICFLTVLKAGKSKFKLSAHLLPGDRPLPDLQMAALLPYSHMAKEGSSSVYS